MVSSVEFSRDSKRLVSGGADKFARVTDRDTGHSLLRRAYQFGSGGQHEANGGLASVGADGEVKVWNRSTATGRANREATPSALHPFLGTDRPGLHDRCREEARILRIPLGNPANVRDLSGAVDVLHAGGVSIGGGVVAAGGESGVLRVWKVADGKLIASFEPPVADEVAKAAE